MIRRNRTTVDYLEKKMNRLIIQKANVASWHEKSSRLRTTRKGKSDPLGIVQETEFWTYWQMEYAQTRIVLEKETHKIHWEFEIQMDHLIPTRRRKLVLTDKWYRTCRLVDFVVLVKQRVKIKESKKIDKYLDLARELKKSCGSWQRRWY